MLATMPAMVAYSAVPCGRSNSGRTIDAMTPTEVAVTESLDHLSYGSTSRSNWSISFSSLSSSLLSSFFKEDEVVDDSCICGIEMAHLLIKSYSERHNFAYFYNKVTCKGYY